jgi:PHD/YefM family antitoxin component YafN of YafNO toxin-antitoxin module
MIKQVTFSEFEDNLDQYLDQVENDKLLEFHIVDRQGKPVARLVSKQAGEREEQPLLILENRIKSLESRRQK